MAKMPTGFAVGKVMMEVFEEMQPSWAWFDMFASASGFGQNETEVGRFLIIHNGKVLVSRNNGGASRKTMHGIELTLIPPQSLFSTVGRLHSHPDDVMPSSVDLEGIITGDHLIEFIITPQRVISLLRSTDTPLHTQEIGAKSYLNAMGIAKGRMPNIYDKNNQNYQLYQDPSFRDGIGWTCQWDDIGELRIAGFQAERNSPIFERII